MASAGAGAPAGAAAPGGLALSTEFQPQQEGTVYGLAAIDESTVVSGDDKGNCFVWCRAGAGAAFTAQARLLEHEGSVRAVVRIPPGTAGLPSGGFATACMDKRVRVYSLTREAGAAGPTATLVHTLAGHTMGVISLSWFPEAGRLLSGAWDGTVRVWDLASGACVATLAGHENGTCAAGLPSGDIVVGSTGRKNDANQHVDYQIRVWRRNAAGGYDLARSLRDHDQAVRDVSALPDGGYVSVGNDGFTKRRAPDGAVRVAFCNPVSDEGKPFSTFRVHVTAGGDVASACEDQTVRVYSPDGSMTPLRLPGTPWAVASLPESGDIVVGCGQAGTSKRGHIYVFSARADRAADEFTTLTFATDCAPPAAASGGAGGGAGGGGGDRIKITGAYEAREAYAGAADGQYGFFKRTSDGAVMVCAWSAEAGTWADIGEMEGGDASANGVSAIEEEDADGRRWDYNCPVTLDTSSGMRSMTLRFDEREDSVDAATRFCEANGVPLESVGQVSAFIMERKMERAAAGKRVRTIPTFRHFPVSAYVDATAIDWKKVAPKFAEFNGAVAASADPAAAALALSEAELQAWTALVGVLEATARYHSSKVPRAAVATLLRKALRWPSAQLLPALDALRMLVLHSDGADAVAEASGGADAFVTAESGRVRALAADSALRGATLTAGRVLLNAFRHESLREAVYRQAQVAVLPAVTALLGAEHATVQSVGAGILLNLAALSVEKRRARIAADQSTVSAGLGVGGAGSAAAADADDATTQAGIAAALAALGGGRLREEEPLWRVVVALGSLAVLDPALAAFAKSNGADAALAAATAAGGGSAAVTEAVTELRAALSASA